MRVTRWGSGFWRTPEDLAPKPSNIVAFAEAGTSRNEYRVEALTPHGAVLAGGPFLAPESEIALVLCVPGRPRIETIARVVHASRPAGGTWRLMLVLQDFRRCLELERSGIVEA